MEMSTNSVDRIDGFKKLWYVPIPIDLPAPLVVPGCKSQEKQIEAIRQQSTLQEIYFSKAKTPDCLQEPELHDIAHKEPKVIPLDEENIISALNDFSNYKPYKPVQIKKEAEAIEHSDPVLPNMPIPLNPHNPYDDDDCIESFIKKTNNEMLVCMRWFVRDFSRDDDEMDDDDGEETREADQYARNICRHMVKVANYFIKFVTEE